MNKKQLMQKKCGAQNAYQSVIEELKVLKLLNHPNIIWLNEIIDDPKKDKLYVVTEWLSKGSLQDAVENKNKGKSTRVGLPIKQVRNYLRDMVKALHYCHDVAQVYHRDIKPDNIMVNHNNEAILIDFGVSALIGDGDFIQSQMGTLLFFAPEMFHKDKKFKVQGAVTDLWALGVTFYYLITGQYPFDATNFFDLKRKVLQEEINFELIKQPEPKELLKKLLIKNPENRAKLETILNDPWITRNGDANINLQELDYSREDG